MRLQAKIRHVGATNDENQYQGKGKGLEGGLERLELNKAKNAFQESRFFI